jgi:hypothetical protein
MTGIGMLLSAVGVKFTPEHIHQIEVMIPQIPGILRQSVEAVNASLTRLDARQTELERAVLSLAQTVTNLAETQLRLETELQLLREVLEDGRGKHHHNDNGNHTIGTGNTPGGSVARSKRNTRTN